MSFTTWLSLVAVCCMGAISPGPSLAVILRTSLSNSHWHGAVAAVTHGFGVGLWALLTMWGLVSLMNSFPELFHGIAVAGGLYLIWMGIKAWRYAGQAGVMEENSGNSSLYESARDGLLISLLNPKLALFFLALFSQFLSQNMDTLLQIQLWATVVVIDGGWYLLVAFLLAGGGVLPWLRKRLFWIDRGMGCLLIGLGIKVVMG